MGVGVVDANQLMICIWALCVDGNLIKKLLKKEIINYTFTSREEAIIEESKLILENIKNPLNMNFHIPNKGFYNKSRISKNLPQKKYKMIQLDYEIVQMLKLYANSNGSSIIDTVHNIIAETIGIRR